VAGAGHTCEAASPTGRGTRTRLGTKPRRAGPKIILQSRQAPRTKVPAAGIGILDAPRAWMDEAQQAQWFYAVRRCAAVPADRN
jgi:hypothetical protein